MRQKCRTGLSPVRQNLSPKNTECLYVRQEHFTIQNTIILFHLSPKNPICRLKKKKLRSCDKQLSYERQINVAQKHIMYVRQEDIAAQQTKILFLCDKTYPPCNNFVTLKHKNSIWATSVYRTCDNNVTQKRRNCVSATGAHKHYNFINIST